MEICSAADDPDSTAVSEADIAEIPDTEEAAAMMEAAVTEEAEGGRRLDRKDRICGQV